MLLHDSYGTVCKLVGLCFASNSIRCLECEAHKKFGYNLPVTKMHMKQVYIQWNNS